MKCITYLLVCWKIRIMEATVDRLRLGWTLSPASLSDRPWFITWSMIVALISSVTTALTLLWTAPRILTPLPLPLLPCPGPTTPLPCPPCPLSGPTSPLPRPTTPLPCPPCPLPGPTSPLPRPTTPLPLPGIILFSFWFFLLFCIHKTNSKRYFLLYVVDVMERVSTPDYSSNWDWNQLFLNISVICYLKVLISCYNTLYREHFSILLSCCCSRSRSFILYLGLEH